MSTHIKTLIFVVGVSMGIMCGYMSSYASEIGLLMLALGMVQGGVYVYERKRNKMSDAVGITHLISFSLITILFCVGIFVGIVRVQLETEKTNFVCNTTCTFRAKIISSPETKNDYQIFNVKNLSSDDTVHDILVRSNLYPKYKIGETVKLSGKVVVPSVIYPHTNIKNNNGFDYASYLLTKNVGSEMTYPNIEVIDESAHSVTDVLGRAKENFVTRINMYVSEPASVLAGGMLFGASSISQELAQTFRTAGLSHIIVLSGFNIVIVIASILFVLAFLPLVMRIVIASIGVIFFVIMVGGEPSVIRATLMAFVALLAMLVGRPYVARQALILSLFAIVMYEPYSLTQDASLHLSFLATVGLVYMSGFMETFFGKYFKNIPSVSFKEIFVTSLSAYFATLPYVMYAFGTVSVYALIANIIVVPFVPIAMLLSFLVVVSSYVSSTLAGLFGFLDTSLINFIIWVAQSIEELPFSMLTITISFQIMCLIYIFIFCFIKYFSMKQVDETRVTIENGYLTDIISY